jgi:hypothetical protein
MKAVARPETRLADEHSGYYPDKIEREERRLSHIM